MQDVQKQLEKIVAYGEAGGGMVKASVSGILREAKAKESNWSSW